jgi:hypothetical protein
MSYRTTFSKDATSEQIKEQIEEYEKRLQEDTTKRDKSIRAQDHANEVKWDREVQKYERLLINLRADLELKEKKESSITKSKQDKSEAKKEIERLIHELLAIVQTL